MTKEIETQTEAFMKGFKEIIPYKAIKLINENELGLKLAGVRKIDS